MATLYHQQLLQPSSVDAFATIGNLCLVARSNLMQLYYCCDDRLFLVKEYSYFTDRIKLLFALPGARKFGVLLSNYYFFILGLKDEGLEADLTTLVRANLMHKYGRKVTRGELYAVNKDYIVLVLYEGFMKIISTTGNSNVRTIRIKEVMIKSMALDSNNVLTIIHGTGSVSRHRIKEDSEDLEELCSYSNKMKLDDVLYFESSGTFGLLIDSETVSLIDLADNSFKIAASKALTTFKDINSVVKIHDDRGYMLFNDKGEALLLRITNSSQIITTPVNFSVDAKAVAGCYVEEDMLILSTFLSDAGLFRLSQDSKEIQLLDSLKCHSPFTDVAVQKSGKDDNSQKKLIISSPSAVKVVRSGINLELTGEVALDGDVVVSVFNLGPRLIMFCFIDSSRVVGHKINEENYLELDETSLKYFDEESTLYATILDKTIIQVCRSGIYIAGTKAFDVDGTSILFSTEMNKNNLLAIVTASKYLIVLQVSSSGINKIAERQLDEDVSCLSLNDANQILFCYWNTNLVEELQLNGDGSFDSLWSCSDFDDLARACTNKADIYISFTDSSLSHFVRNGEKSVSKDVFKSIYLGNQQPVIGLKALDNDASMLLCLCGESTFMVTNTEGKLKCSEVSYRPEDSTTDSGSMLCAAVLDSEGSTASESNEVSLLFASKDNLTFATIDLTLTQSGSSDFNVNSFPLASEDGLKLVPKRIVSIGEETAVLCENCFAILDPLFRIKFYQQLEKDETGLSLTTIRGEYIVVGTGYNSDESEMPLKGRIMVFSYSSSKGWSLETVLSVRGAVFCMSHVPETNLLFAGINAAAYLFSIRTSDSKEFDIVQESVIKGNYIVLSMDYIAENQKSGYLAVGDLLKSISVVKLDISDDGYKVEEVGVDSSGSKWITAVCSLKDLEGNCRFISASNSNDLMVFALSPSANNEKALDIIAKFHTGVHINKFIRINDNYVVYVGVCGTIGMVKFVDHESYGILETCQKAIQKSAKGFGGLDITEFRNGARVLDGDVLNKFREIPGLEIAGERRISDLLYELGKF